MTAIFLSDVHIDDPASMKSKLVVRFLQERASKFEQIFIMGDLFDVWPTTSAYLISKYEPILKTLKGLVAEGHQLHYFEGNHDFHLGNYFIDELGICVYPNATTMNWNGKRIYLAHGDLGNSRSIGYRALRYILRRDMTRMAIKTVPQKWIYNLGAKSSFFSRRYQSRVGRNDAAVRQIYRKAAEHIFSQGYDVVLMGHTHLPDDVTTVVNGRKCRYINTGDWVKHFSYVEFDGEQFYTKAHPLKSM